MRKDSSSSESEDEKKQGEEKKERQPWKISILEEEDIQELRNAARSALQEQNEQQSIGKSSAVEKELSYYQLQKAKFVVD